MYLKSLEIKGFKSFADRTYIEFPKGIISVVGPNGSGKSNILDSVLWVLGEQSYKNIRAKEGADVIFSGGKNRKALSMAEVTLIINNEDKKLPIEYNEVKIERKIYGSGENEYFINKNRVRLKDIQELFLDTGIGKTAYSVIGQGKVEEILISTPKDLKGLIEEAAGIKRFKKKKEEAELKLKDVEDNIEKIGYIEVEIEENLGPLKEQSDKAKEYKSLKEEHRKSTASLLKKEMFFKDSQQKGMKSKNDEIQKNVLELENKFEILDDEVKTITSDIEEKERFIDETELSEEKLKEAIQILSNEEILYVERIKNLTREETEKRELLAGFEEKNINKFNKIENLKRDKESIELKLKTEEKIINTTSIKQKDYIIEKQAIEKFVKESNEKIMSFEIDKIKISNDIEQNEKNIKLILAKNQRLEKELLELDEKENNVFKESEEKALEKSKIDRLLNDLNLKKNENETIYSTLFSEIKDMKKELEMIEGKSQNRRLKIETLQNLENNYEGFFKGVKEVLNSGIKGIVGPFVSIVKIPEKLESALEASVGNGMQDIVVEDSNIAKECIEFLKKNQMGRASFLPFDTLKVNPNRFESNDIGKNGVLGFASDLVEYDKKYEKVIKFVLGNTLIVENIDIGIEFFKNNNFSGTIVSLDGEIISGRGKITGGEKIKGSISVIFERKREMTRLKEELAGIVSIIKEKKIEIDKHMEKTEQIALKLEEYKKSINTHIEDIRNIDFLIEQKSKNINEIRKIKILVNTERMEENNRYKELISKIEEYKLKISNTNEMIGEYKRSNLEKEKRAEELEIEMEKINNEHSENKIEFIKIKEKYSMICEKVEEEDKEHKELVENIKSYKGKLELINKEIDESGNRLEVTREKLERNKAEYVRDSEILKGEKEKYRELENLEKKRIFELKDIENRINMERSALSKNLKDYERLKEELLEVQAKINELGDIENIEMASDDSKTKKLIIQLEEKIKLLGDVNIFSIEEYEKTYAKHLFLKQQKEDLLTGEKNLKNLIKEIESDIINKFAEAYKEIRKNFIYTCEEVLNNAKGDIVLTNPDNLLETGAELEVKFQNKKSQTLTLLSGGEKSMVAVAFIMAIFLFRPSPFTFFDEIEAALDESNTKKLLKMLKNFTKDSQFILITHNKETMRESDILYGVTMNKEEGVSKLVSVSL